MHKVIKFISLLMIITIIFMSVEGYRDVEKQCPDFVNRDIFYSSDKISTGLPGRAFETVPKDFNISTSKIPGGGLGVFSKTSLQKNIWLGEYEGDFVPLNFTGPHKLAYSWLLFNNGQPTHYVDASDLRVSNWLRFVNCARHVTEQNIGHSLCYGRIFYRTIKNIEPGQELLIYYGYSYARTLGIDVKNYYKI